MNFETVFNVDDIVYFTNPFDEKLLGIVRGITVEFKSYPNKLPSIEIKYHVEQTITDALKNTYIRSEGQLFTSKEDLEEYISNYTHI